MRRLLIALAVLAILALGLGWIFRAPLRIQASSILSQRFAYVARRLSVPTPTPTPALREFVTSLAQHLSKNGAIVYGSYRCGACARQKELFANRSGAAILRNDFFGLQGSGEPVGL